METIIAKARIAWVLLTEACSRWVTDNAPSLGAALAFYALFSLAPVLLVATIVAGVVFGREAVQGQILQLAQALMGPSGAAAIQALVQGFNRPALGTVASCMGVGTLLFGASGAFVELQGALNRIWRINPRSENLLVHTMRKRLLSFALVLGTGCLLMVSFVLSAMLAVAGKFMVHLLSAPPWLLESVHSLLSFSLITLLFAMIFKVLPDTEIAWSNVWPGAAVTSLLFTIGKVLIGIYLGMSAMVSAFGAAASLVVILIWIYYSAQIFLFGAEFTHIYASLYGSKVELLFLA